ncbi:MAG: hypothetical protein AAF570_08165 [Bacteroidota bacterium]
MEHPNTEPGNTIINQTDKRVCVEVYEGDNRLDHADLDPHDTHPVLSLVAQMGTKGRYYKIGYKGNAPGTFMDVWIPFGQWSPIFQVPGSPERKMEMICRNDYAVPCRIIVKEADGHIVVGELDVGGGEGGN